MRANSWARISAASITVAFTLLVTVSMATGPARADVLGELSMKPASGPNNAFPTLTTPKGCPQGTDLYAGVMYGAGLPAEGALAVQPSSWGLSLAGPFAVEMYPFQDIIELAGASVLSGVYTIELRCQDQFSNVTGVFTAQVDFASPTAFTALGAAAAPAPAVPTPVNPVDPNAGVSPVAPVPGSGASEVPNAPSSSAESSPEASVGGEQTAASVRADDGSNTVLLLWLAAAAAFLGAIGLGYAAFRRAQTQTVDEPAADVESEVH